MAFCKGPVLSTSYKHPSGFTPSRTISWSQICSTSSTTSALETRARRNPEHGSTSNRCGAELAPNGSRFRLVHWRARSAKGSRITVEIRAADADACGRGLEHTWRAAIRKSDDHCVNHIET